MTMQNGSKVELRFQIKQLEKQVETLNSELEEADSKAAKFLGESLTLLNKNKKMSNIIKLLVDMI